MQLQVIENDLSEALTYLDSCQTCTMTTHRPRAACAITTVISAARHLRCFAGAVAPVSGRRRRGCRHPE